MINRADFSTQAGLVRVFILSLASSELAKSIINVRGARARQMAIKVSDKFNRHVILPGPAKRSPKVKVLFLLTYKL